MRREVSNGETADPNKGVDPMKQTYLGDGLYARFDGFQVWLETSGGGGAQTVALEPAVIAAFSRYVQKIRDDYGVPDWGK